VEGKEGVIYSGTKGSYDKASVEVLLMSDYKGKKKKVNLTTAASIPHPFGVLLRLLKKKQGEKGVKMAEEVRARAREGMTIAPPRWERGSLLIYGDRSR